MNTVLSQSVLRWSLPIITIAWAAFLLRVSTYDRGELILAPPGASAGFPNLLLSPALHLGAYGVLASLLVLSVWAVWPRLAVLPVPLTASFVATTAYGAALELYQTTLSTRAGTWDNAAFNGIGAAVALAVLTALRRWQGSRERT